jgi:hypothetical protein
MPACPQCNKPLRELVRRCPTCQADLDLLVDYVSHLTGGLERAENLVKAGELGEAVWAFLEVLETDPDNGPARKQIGRVVTAVRTFDLSTPARRVAIGLPPQEPRGFWKYLPGNDVLFGGIAMLLLGLVVGIMVGVALPRGETTTPTSEEKKDPPPGLKNDTLMGPQKQ